MNTSWGPYVWYFFHTFAEKMKEEFFINNKVKIINLFTSILPLLPCPLCSTHALQNIKKFKLNNINNKKDYKKFIFEFHNLVNQQLTKKIFTEYELNDKYKKGNLKKIYNVFCYHMLKNYHLGRNLNDSLLRKIYIKNLNDFLNGHKEDFN
jgi:hypothetical protein